MNNDLIQCTACGEMVSYVYVPNGICEKCFNSNNVKDLDEIISDHNQFLSPFEDNDARYSV